MSSRMFFAGTLGLTTSTIGVEPIMAIGVMSLTGSNGSDLSTLG